jgi:hypothetical protein
VEMSMEQLIRFHLVVYAHLYGITLSKGDLNALTLLGIRGKQPLIDFCNELVTRKVFLSVQSARNGISKLENEYHMVQKEGTRLMTVQLADAIGISNEKNTMLDVKCIYR